VESIGYRPLFAIYAGIAAVGVLIFGVMDRRKH